MKIFNTSQIRQLDADNILRRHITSLELMEEAVNGLFPSVCEEIERCRQLKNKKKDELTLLVLAGPGNNGGDGLALARKLILNGYHLVCRLIRAGKTLSADCQANKESLSAIASDFAIWDDLSHLDDLPSADIVIDCLFGSGLNRPIQGIFAELVHWINQSRSLSQPPRIVSIDLPSGLFGEDNSDNLPDSIVRSDLTLGIQSPRLAFFLSENEKYIPQWKLTPLFFHPTSLAAQDSPYSYGEPSDIASLWQPRHRFDHKGRFGRALLIAGSAEMCGAAILASKACLRSGVGLLNVWSPEKAHDCIQSAVPEAMVGCCGKEYPEWNHTLNFSGYSAVGIGPGIGVGESQTRLLENSFAQWPDNLPLILDADGLNILKHKPDLLNALPKQCVFSPHPKEFERIFEASLSLEKSGYKPSRNGYERLCRARQFARKHHVTLLLKGAYTAVIQPNGDCWLNPTGNPGMATGGSGDVLTGILLSLLAQGYSCAQAAKMAVYLHGLSGDLALDSESEESLTASDIIAHLGKAFKRLHNDKQLHH